MLGGPFGAVLLWSQCLFDDDGHDDGACHCDGGHVLGTPSAK